MKPIKHYYYYYYYFVLELVFAGAGGKKLLLRGVSPAQPYETFGAGRSLPWGDLTHGRMFSSIYPLDARSIPGAGTVKNAQTLPVSPGGGVALVEDPDLE